jgi:hypothetical protein
MPLNRAVLARWAVQGWEYDVRLHFLQLAHAITIEFKKFDLEADLAQSSFDLDGRIHRHIGFGGLAAH